MTNDTIHHPFWLKIADAANWWAKTTDYQYPWMVYIDRWAYRKAIKP